MLKVVPHPDYPSEDGRFVRGNDASPVAVAIILNHDADKIPPEIESLVRTGIESGAALSGTIQTENKGKFLNSFYICISVRTIGSKAQDCQMAALS